MDRFCTRCGAQAGGTPFCTHCGSAISPTAEAGQREEPVPVVPSATGQLPAPAKRETLPPRRSNGWLAAVVLAVVLAAGSGALLAWIQWGGDESSAAGSVNRPDADPKAATETGADHPAPASTTIAPPTPSPPPASPSAAPAYAPPADTPFYTAVVISLTDAQGGRPAAEAYAQAISEAGYRPLVFFSSQYSHLRAGYWVAAAGVFPDLEQARSAVRDLQPRYDSPVVVYPRCVGSTAECPGDDE